ncbi:hypothetical protein F4861DRAFT_93257 [Xylaria intraflava]|nr:hypothetical protein F4861DRAFT_93257 [Xylaria intraflava]
MKSGGIRLQSTLRTAIARNKLRLETQHLASKPFSSSTTQKATIWQPVFSRIDKSSRHSLSSITTVSPNPSSKPFSTMDASSETKEENNSAQPESQSPSQPAELPALPAAGSATATLEVGGSALRLDHLGPLVVNEDGTLSRIANWEKMAEIERENTLRIIGKRNQMRLAKLRAAKSEQDKPENRS